MMAEQLNRGKLSVDLDPHKEADRATFRELVRRCDVIAESYTPGVMERLGVTPEAVRAANPGAVMISVSAFGQSGPTCASMPADRQFETRFRGASRP